MRLSDKSKIFYLYYQSAIATKLGKMMTYFEGFLIIKSYDRLITRLAKSRDKLKLLCHHYHSAYSHQTWQSVDLP